MTDQSDEGLSYRELLIITLSSSVLIIVIILISVLSLLHRRHRDKCLHGLRHPDLIPGPGSGSGAASVSGTVVTPNILIPGKIQATHGPLGPPKLETLLKEKPRMTRVCAKWASFT